MIRRAFSANFVPALALWCFAALLLALYYLHAPTHQLLGALAAFKTRFGLGFSMPAQALCAAVLPWAFQHFQRGAHRKTQLSHLPFLTLMGAASDGFYRFQAQLFGDSSRFTSVAPKVAVDMLLYTPLFAMPVTVVAFALKDSDFSPRKTRELLGRDWVRRHVLPVYCVGLLVWAPTVTLIYALPLALQFPFQAIVSCLWGLILVIMTAK